MTTTGHHITGTCQMGDRSNSMAVVDSQLRVHGIKNLRLEIWRLASLAPDLAAQLLIEGHTVDM